MQTDAQRPEPEDPGESDLLSKELVFSSLVHEVTRVMLSASTLPQAIQAFMLGIMELTGVQNIGLFTLDKKSSTLECSQCLGIFPSIFDTLRPTPESPTVKACLSGLSHVLVENLQEDDPFVPTGTESYLLLPITARNNGEDPEGNYKVEALALVWLDTTPPCPETTGQAISHLTGLAQQVGLLMESFRAQTELTEAYAALSAAQKRLEDDMDRARTIQRNLLPKELPAHLLKGSAIRYIPAGRVGGDYYDCFELEPGIAAVVIADVSGHGMGAAMVMSMFKALLRIFSAQEQSPAEVLNRINKSFIGHLGGSQFVTACYGVFRKEARTLTYCNAGHIAPFVQRGGGILEMPSQGLVLGIFENTFLSDAVVELGPEARLFLFTDGISEAHGPTGKMFGPEPLMELAGVHSQAAPDRVMSALFQALDGFLGVTRVSAATADGEPDAPELADDATLVILDL